LFQARSTEAPATAPLSTSSEFTLSTFCLKRTDNRLTSVAPVNDLLSDTATAQTCAFQGFTNPSRYLSCLADRVHRRLTTSYPNEVSGVLLGWFLDFFRIFCASGIRTQGARLKLAFSPFLTIELEQHLCESAKCVARITLVKCVPQYVLDQCQVCTAVRAVFATLTRRFPPPITPRL
jgi:hypothetical protein